MSAFPGVPDVPVFAESALSALFGDVSAAVTVCNRDGRFLHANQAAIRIAGGSEKLLNLKHEEIMPQDYAAERAGYVARAIESGKVIRVLGMGWGTRKCTTYRPFRDPQSGETLCLVICQAAESNDACANFAPNEDGMLLEAKIQDLGPLCVLTERELELLSLIGAGLSTAEVATRLHRSVKTVEWHRASIGAKLGVKNRVELARIAMRAGLVGLSVEQIDRLKAGASKPPTPSPVTNTSLYPPAHASDAMPDDDDPK